MLPRWHNKAVEQCGKLQHMGLKERVMASQREFVLGAAVVTRRVVPAVEVKPHVSPRLVKRMRHVACQPGLQLGRCFVVG